VVFILNLVRRSRYPGMWGGDVTTGPVFRDPPPGQRGPNGITDTPRDSSPADARGPSGALHG